MTNTGANNEIVDGLWAIVVLQGAITLTTAIEAVVGTIALGSIAVAGPVLVLTLGGALLALVSARGLRLRRRWAKRVTLVAESLLLVLGLLGIGLALVMGAGIGLVPVVTNLVVPAVVLALLIRNSSVFVAKGA